MRMLTDEEQRILIVALRDLIDLLQVRQAPASQITATQRLGEAAAFGLLAYNDDRGPSLKQGERE